MKPTSKKVLSEAVRANILRSAVASFRIENIQITPAQAAAAQQKAVTPSGKSTR